MNFDKSRFFKLHVGGLGFAFYRRRLNRRLGFAPSLGVAWRLGFVFLHLPLRLSLGLTTLKDQ